MFQYIILGMIAVIVALILIWAFVISSGKVKPYRDAEGNILPNSICEKIIVECNGAKNGFFINGKDLNNPVLLFVSSGPGTDDYFFNEKYKEMHLEDEYTVCYWDYRGM